MDPHPLAGDEAGLLRGDDRQDRDLEAEGEVGLSSSTTYVMRSSSPIAVAGTGTFCR